MGFDPAYPVLGQFGPRQTRSDLLYTKTKTQMAAAGSHLMVFAVTAGDTVFISVATYRDENCPNTIKEAFQYVSLFGGPPC
jgi:hypothetical protein